MTDEDFAFLCFGIDDDLMDNVRRQRAIAAVELIRTKPDMTFIERRGLGNLIKDFYIDKKKPGPGRPPKRSMAHDVAMWVARQEAEWLRQHNKKKIPSETREKFISAGITLRRKYRPNEGEPTEDQVKELLSRKERLFPSPRMTRAEIQNHFDCLQKLGAFDGWDSEPEV